MRKIPTTMATQHPDNSSIPFWHDREFISTQDEVREIYENFSTLGVDEYMWDWEGKYADEAIFEKLFAQYLEYFKKHQVGRDEFITLRIPNIWEEKTFKLPRAYISVLSAAEFVTSLGLHCPPVLEFILPMTKSADQLIHIQETFEQTSKLHEKIFSHQARSYALDYIQIIPLFESIDDLAGCGEILEEYLKLHQKKFKKNPPYLRVFIARSDPALNAGFVPAVLASRMAVREIWRVSKKTGVPMYPIIGTGTLPFRGGANPTRVEAFLAQNPGIKTYTIQSAFRYDFELGVVKKALKKIAKVGAEPVAVEFSDADFKGLKKINEILRKPYCATIEAAAKFVNEMAAQVPKRRERMQHTGLFGYNRGVGKTKLPRAITFTAAWYSAGIPPELIGVGRGLQEVEKAGLMPLLLKHFPLIWEDLHEAGRFVNWENLAILSEKHAWAKDVFDEIRYLDENYDVKAWPSTDEELIHRNLTSTLMLKKRAGMDFSYELLEAAKIRKSLG